MAAARAALGSAGHVAQQGKLQREERRAVGCSGATRGSHKEQEVARGRPSTAVSALHCTAAARNRAGELEEGEKDPNAISEISRDQTVKQR